MPKVSIIIPCYNQGHFLGDALDSLRKCDQTLFEVIIVNDGSTDSATIHIFKELEKEGYRIIHQTNMGLAAARNAGIKAAIGQYILPLDADNKIRPEYLTEAVSVMDQQTEVAMLYGNAAYFGDKSGDWVVGDFNLQRLMIGNYIDACAVVRKSVFEQLGGYETTMKLFGLEDWELWLRMSFAGFKFHYVNKVLFDYRVVSTSMSKALVKSYEKRNLAEGLIEQKYSDKMGGRFILNHYVNRFKKSPVSFLTKLVLLSWFPGIYHRLLKKNKIVKGL
ncbi:MAG: glycosyltransferase family 2 protein [Chitinophagaceae bacterium]|nr:glycosyltransferase family 2 protein [Chitinophagaceae bacterium]